MTAETTRRGAAAEEAALSLLQGQGMVLLARNVRYRVGELDLVMAAGQTTVFVEVRHRQSASHGGAAGSIDAGKRKRLQAAAQLWLQSHPGRARLPCRFDVVLSQGEPPRLRWLPDAFQASDY